MRGKRILLFVFCIVPFLLAMPLQAAASTVNSGNAMPEEPVWEEPADHGSIDRFGTTSPWLSGTQDESIYGNTIVSPEELQDISAKEPGMVEKGISELVRNTGSALISLLQDSIGASLDRVVYGRVGSGRPNMVNVYAFELRKGNPYGVAASVCYALLRGMMFIFLGISFVFQLAKAAWSGQTARSRDEIKSMLPDMAAKFIAMAPGEISGQPYDLKYKSQKLADLYYVKVVAIEEDVSKVWVSCNAARRDMRPQIEEEINRCLKAGKEKKPYQGKG